MAQAAGQKSTQKTVMNRSLARALIEAGMEHFDAGGPVPGIQNPNVNPSDPSKGFLGDIGSFFTAQNGYQAELAPQIASDYSGIINTAADRSLAGYDVNSAIQAQQQQLAQELLDQSHGGGPNPAQAALNANTGVNVANIGALMAGQRGAGANPALIARQIGQTGAGIQQNAVGQEAILQAQQQLAAQKALQAQQAQIAAQNLHEQGLNTSLYGTSVAGQNTQNQTNVANYGMAQGLNQKTAEKNTERAQGGLEDVFDTAGELLSEGPKKMFAALFNEGGEVSDRVPPHLRKLAEIAHGDKFKKTGLVPGRPGVGNSVKNDTVPALLSPGEVVLPTSVTQAKNAPSKAQTFMRHIQEKKRQGEVKKKGYAHVAEKKRKLSKMKGAH